jgi:hypothetical protein
VLGPKADLPKSMLPGQVDKVLRALGDDGDRVRGVLEREFVDYLEKGKPARESRDLRGTISVLGGSLLGPATSEAGKRLAAELFKPEGGSFSAVTDRIRARRASRESEAGAGSVDVAPAGERRPPSVPSRWERRSGRGRKS